MAQKGEGMRQGEGWNFETFKNRLAPTVWSRFKLKARLREIRTQLPDLIEGLEAACKEVEPDFIQVGQELQEIYGKARQLTQQVLDSVNLIGGKDEGGVLFHLRGLAQTSLVQLENCRKDLSEKTTLMQSLMAHLEGLSGECHAIEKVGLLLRVVAVNVGIESARSVASSELFSVVAQDTASLSGKIRATMEEGLDVLKMAWRAQQSLHMDLSKGSQEIDRLGGRAHVIVREAVQGIEGLMEGTRHFVEQAGEHSRQIQRQVGDLVMAIQFHDSMSQRVEHITSALGDVERFLDGDASTNGKDHGGKASHAFSLIRVQSAQLKDIIQEVERVHKGGLHSFEEILNGFRSLVERLSEIKFTRKRDSGMETPEDDPFKRLSSSFGELNGVLHRGQELMDGVQHAASRASETVDHISKCVKEMNTLGVETHIMALNAIIKAAHLGEEGGAIEVLAHEVNQSAVQSRSVLCRAAELLDGITITAERLRGEMDTNAFSRKSFDAVMEDIAQAYLRFTETTDVAYGRADEITAAIRKTKSRLDFLQNLSETFSASLFQIESMLRDLRPLATRGDDLGEKEAAEVLNRYTMEKEREVHEISLYGAPLESREEDVSRSVSGAGWERGRGDLKASAALPDNIDLFSNDGESPQDAGSGDVELFTAGEPETMDGSWDNIELFDAGPEPAEPSAGEEACAGPKEVDASWDNVELFDDEPEPAEPSAGEEACAGPKEVDASWDNVELFDDDPTTVEGIVCEEAVSGADGTKKEEETAGVYGSRG